MSVRTFKVVLNDGKETKKIKLVNSDIASVKQELCRRLELEPNMSLAAILRDDCEEYSITTSDDLEDNWDDIMVLNVSGKQKETTAIRSIEAISVILNKNEKKKMAFKTLDFVEIKTTICDRFNIKETGVTIEGSIKGDRDLYTISSNADVEQLWTFQLKELHIKGTKKRMQVNLQVVIENETYKVDQIPEIESMVVKDARRDLGVINNIEEVNRRLRMVGVIASVSFFAVVATGKEVPVGMKELGLDAKELCSAVDYTLQSYILTSRSVNETFNTAIIYLLENDYARALIMISSLEETAQICVERTEALISTIDEVSKRVAFSTVKTKEEILQEREKAKTCEKEQRKKKIELRNVADETSAPGDVEKKTAWQKVVSTVVAGGKVVGKVETGSVPEFFLSAGFALLKFAAENADIEEKKKEKEQKRQEEKQRKKAEAEKQQLQLKMDLDDLKKGIKEAKNSEKCLPILNGELLKMRADLQNLKFFFLELTLFCDVIKKSERQIKECMTVESSEASDGKKVDCKPLFESGGFKKQLVSFQAMWVALKLFCVECRGTLKITEKELYEHIQRNPTKQEAGEQVYAMIEEAKNV